MIIRNVLVVDRLGLELERALVTVRPSWNLRRLALEDVREEDVAWADAYVGFRFPRAVPESAIAKLSWAHSTGAGVDGFLDGRTWPADVVLTRTTGAFGERIGEYCVAHALARCQHVNAYREAQHAGRWDVHEARDLAGTRAMIVGTGHVGRGIAHRFQAMGVAVMGVSRTGCARDPFERVITLDGVRDVLASMDWVILALPLTEATRGRFGFDVLRHARGAHLMNVARGAIAPEAELLRALRGGFLSGVTLDVFEREPLPEASELWAEPNVVVTPHVAARTLPCEALESLLQAAEDLEAGRVPALRVDVAHGY